MIERHREQAPLRVREQSPQSDRFAVHLLPPSKREGRRRGATAR
jgi:hypothetical protein